MVWFTHVSPEKAALQACARDDAFALECALLACRRDGLELKTWRDATLLHVCAGLGHVACLNKLLELGGFDIEAKTINGTTPLMWATENDQSQCVELLIQRGANVNAEDVFGNTVVTRGMNAEKKNTVSQVKKFGGKSSRSNVVKDLEAGVLKAESSSLRGPSERVAVDLQFATTSSPVGQINMNSNPIKMPVADDSVPTANLITDEFGALKPGGCYGVFCSSPQRVGFVSTVFLWVWLSLQIGCRYGRGLPASTCNAIGFQTTAGLVVLILAIICYVVEAYFCKASYYLWNARVADRGFVEYLSGIKYQPVFHFKIECYHKETRGSGKNRHTHKVVTHRAEEIWTYDEYCDDDDAYPLFDGVARIDLEREHVFGDEATQRNYEEMKSAFISRNTRDTFQDVTTPIDMPAAMDHISIDKAKAPFVSFNLYVIASVLLMSMPYRAWMVYITAKKQVRMRKVIYKVIAIPSLPYNGGGVTDSVVSTGIAVGYANNPNNNAVVVKLPSDSKADHSMVPMALQVQ